MSAIAATNIASSSGRFRFLPPIILHDKSDQWLQRFLFEQETLPFIPAPRLFILAHAAQDDFIRELLSGEREQSPTEVLPLIFRRNEQHVEIQSWQMQRQHRRDRPVIVRNKQAPALPDFDGNARP